MSDMLYLGTTGSGVRLNVYHHNVTTPTDGITQSALNAAVEDIATVDSDLRNYKTDDARPALRSIGNNLEIAYNGLEKAPLSGSQVLQDLSDTRYALLELADAAEPVKHAPKEMNAWRNAISSVARLV